MMIFPENSAPFIPIRKICISQHGTIAQWRLLPGPFYFEQDDIAVRRNVQIINNYDEIHDELPPIP